MAESELLQTRVWPYGMKQSMNWRDGDQGRRPVGEKGGATQILAQIVPCFVGGPVGASCFGGAGPWRKNYEERT